MLRLFQPSRASTAGVVALVCALFMSCAPSPPPSGPGDDAWRAPASAAAPGAALYAPCASCHLVDAGGREDGSIPRLAGQPAGILTQKLTAIQRDPALLPVMTPFARALTEPEIATLSTWLAALPAPARVGHGPGDALDAGAARYQTACAACHGLDGHGVVDLNAPRLCGQHYGAILRRSAEIATGARPGGDPAMAAMLSTLEPGELEAIADWLSRGDCRVPPAEVPP